MNENKKACILLCISLVFSAIAVAWCLNLLRGCINNVNSANAENGEIRRDTSNNAILGMEIKHADFFNKNSSYNFAENGNCIYYFCQNQYLELSQNTHDVLYFCYDRSVGAPTKGESYCRSAALKCVSQCYSHILSVSPQICAFSFDGRRYVYLISLGERGSVTVHIAADSGKVVLIDGRNINFF